LYKNSPWVIDYLRILILNDIYIYSLKLWFFQINMVIFIFIKKQKWWCLILLLQLHFCILGCYISCNFNQYWSILRGLGGIYSKYPLRKAYSLGYLSVFFVIRQCLSAWCRSDIGAYRLFYGVNLWYVVGSLGVLCLQVGWC
jgi:hypothetical protein